MDAEIKDRPSFANIRVALGDGEKMIAEAGAMASMSSSVQIKTRWNGGFFRAVARRLFGGESLFINEFSSKGDGEFVLTQDVPGDIECIELNGNTLYLQPGAYMASEPGVKLGLGWAGIASCIGREGLFRQKVSGTGKIWFSAYGGIFAKEISDEYVKGCNRSEDQNISTKLISIYMHGNIAMWKQRRIVVLTLI